MFYTPTRSLLKMGLRGLAMLMVFAGFAQAQSGSATVQILHNSPDPAVATVDVIVSTIIGGNEVQTDIYLDDVSYLGATGTISATWSTLLGFPSNDSLDVNVNFYDPSTDGFNPGGSLPTATPLATIPLTIMDGGSYVLAAQGVADPVTFPGLPTFSVKVVPMAEFTSADAMMPQDSVAMSIYHGCPDAPAVDVIERVQVPGLALASNLSFGEHTMYADLKALDYVVDVLVNGSDALVGTYLAGLQTIGAGGLGFVTFAHGFADPVTATSTGNGFGLSALLPDGTVLPLAGASLVQVVHNAPDPVIDTVTIYLDGAVVGDLAFRTALTTYLPVDAQLELLPKGGNYPVDVVSTVDLSTVLSNNKAYWVIAQGLVDPSPFINLVGSTNFSLNVIEGFRTESADPLLVDVRLHHGGPDAGQVDVFARLFQTYVDLADDFDFGESTTVSVGTDEVLVDISPSNNRETPLVTYRLRSSILQLLLAIDPLVIASGFVDADNIAAGGPAFGAFSVLPNGTVIPLEQVVDALLHIIHNSADPAAASVDIYADTIKVAENLGFQTSTAVLLVTGNTSYTFSINGPTSTGYNDQVVGTFGPGFLKAGSNYIGVASGFINPSNFEANPDGESTALNIYGIEVESYASLDPADFDFIVFHGATDAPAVDVVAKPSTVLVSDLVYGEFSDRVSVTPAVYDLAVSPTGTLSFVVSWDGTNLSGQAGAFNVLVASGFLTPTSPDPNVPFDVYVAQYNGPFIPLGALSRLDDALSLVTDLRGFPNPAASRFTLGYSLEEATEVSADVLSLNGQVVYSTRSQLQAVGANSLNLELDGLSNGLYLVRLNVGGQSGSLRLSIQR